MSKTSWKGGSGDWESAGHWTHGAPDAKAKATIGGSGVYTVTIAATESVAARSLKINDAGATLSVDGTLSVGGTLSLAAGTLDLAAGGVVSGATITMGGGAIDFAGGALNACHVVGALDIGAQFASLTVTGGLGVSDAGGGAGQITLDGDGGSIDFKGRQTFDNATITMGSYVSFFDGDFIFASGALTLGSHLAIVSASDHAIATLGGGTIVNDGSISETAQFGLFTIDASAFTNNGAITVGGGGVTGGALLARGKRFVNAAGGAIEIEAGALMRLGANPARGQAATSFSNQGTISVDAGGYLGLAGAFTASDMGAIANAGTLGLEGTLFNSGTLTLGAGALAGTVVLTGTIAGGVVVASPTGNVQLDGTLDAVTWRGTLDLGTQSYVSLQAEDGLTVTGAKGTGRGVVRIDGQNSALYFAGDQTFDDATVHLGDAGDDLASDLIRLRALTGSRSATLTLGGALTIAADAAGAQTRIDAEAAKNTTTTLVNDGAIVSSGAAGVLTIAPDLLVNNGQMTASGGGGLTIGLFTDFTNAGTVAVGAGSRLLLNAGGASSFVNSGAINVAGGGTIDITGAYTPASLGDIENHGTFILDGSIANSGQSITPGSGPLFGGQLTVLGINGDIDGGTLVLGGGPVSWQSGTLSNLQVQGTVDMSAAGSRLFLQGAVTLTGAGGIGTGAIALTGAGAILDFLYDPQTVSQSLDNATLIVGHAGATDAIEMFIVKVEKHTLTFGAGLTIDANVANSTVTIDDSLSGDNVLVNNGTIEATAAGGALIVGLATFTNNGLLAVGGGDTVSVTGALSGGGAITLGSGASLTLAAAAAGQTLTFTDGAGSLALSAAGQFAATLSGFQSGDRIDLARVAADSLTLDVHDRLIVMEGGTTVATLQLSGRYVISQFTLTGDGAGGSLITTSAPAMIQAMAALGAASTPLAERLLDPARAMTALMHGRG